MDVHYQNPKATLVNRRFLQGWLTKAEYTLWQDLRREKLGYKFRRQFGILGFIVDFYCHELRLIIEIDGYIHTDPLWENRDIPRQEKLEKLGYHVLRFTNDEVMNRRDRVVRKIKEVCASLDPRDPSRALPS